MLCLGWVIKMVIRETYLNRLIEAKDTDFIKDSIIYIDGLTTIKGSHKDLLEKNKNYRNLIYIRENVI